MQENEIKCQVLKGSAGRLPVAVSVADVGLARTAHSQGFHFVYQSGISHITPDSGSLAGNMLLDASSEWRKSCTFHISSCSSGYRAQGEELKVPSRTKDSLLVENMIKWLAYSFVSYKAQIRVTIHTYVLGY